MDAGRGGGVGVRRGPHNLPPFFITNYSCFGKKNKKNNKGVTCLCSLCRHCFVRCCCVSRVRGVSGLLSSCAISHSVILSLRLGYCFICKRWRRIERELKTKEKDNITQGINCCGGINKKEEREGREACRRLIGQTRQENRIKGP